MIRIDRFRPRLRPFGRRKLLGQEPPLKPKDIWAIRIRLQLSRRVRDLALFNLAIDSKLRGCDLVSLRVHDVFHSGQVTARAIIMQQKTGCPLQFEITEQTRVALASWIHHQLNRATPVADCRTAHKSAGQAPQISHSVRHFLAAGRLREVIEFQLVLAPEPSGSPRWPPC